MSWEPPPVVKRMVWVFDGSLPSPFDIYLNDRVTVSAGLVLTQYTVTGTPLSGSLPVTPFIYLQMDHMLAGLTLSGCVSHEKQKTIIREPVLPNIDAIMGIPPDATHVALIGATTNVQMQPGKHVGIMKGGETRALRVHVRDFIGRDHEPVNNKLFDWAIFEFEIQETPHARNPLFLVNKVPSIQQTLDTI